MANSQQSTIGDYSGSTLYKARGGPATFDSDKYHISQHSYPTDLMGPLGEYGGNYVIFYINVAVDSKLLKDPSVQTVADNTPRDNGDLTALSNKYDTGALGAVATPAAVGIGGALLAPPPVVVVPRTPYCYERWTGYYDQYGRRIVETVCN